MELRIRYAIEADLPAIVDIYNQSIPAGWSTADTRPITIPERVEWFRKFNRAKRPIWVAEVDGKIVATTSLTSFYGGRPAYDATAEISTYVATACHRQGLGRRLKEFVIEQCPRLGVTTLLSMHFDHNHATPRINESLGFERAGHLTEIAVVQGQKRGLVIWSLRIEPTRPELTIRPAERRGVRIREALFPGEVAAVRELFEEYATGLGIDLCFQGFAEELATLPGRYAQPSGGVWLAEVAGTIAGCIALRSLAGDRSEVKRLYVRPTFRGLGIGRALTQHVMAAAAALGYRWVYLDTLPSMAGAVALYRSLGFTEIKPYYQNPVPGTLFLGRELAQPSAAPDRGSS